MSYFINSVLLGIVPNNILFNVDEKGNYGCIDGKQRLTSLQKFKNNDIPVIFENENDDKIIYAYYSILPNDSEKEDDENIIYRNLTQQEKNNFNQTLITLATYKNISYEDQIEIFHRIQHGKALTAGEKVIAFFSNDNIAKHFTSFCDKKYSILEKFIKNYNRKEHMLHIIYIMYMINKNQCKVITEKTDKQKYLKSIDQLQKIKKETNIIDKLINIGYGNNVLGHSTITSKLQQNFRLITLYLIYNLYKDNIDKITKEQYKILRSTVRKTYRDIAECHTKIMHTKSDIKTLETIYSLMNKYYSDLTKKNCEISDEENSTIIDNNEEEENDKAARIVLADLFC